MEKEVEENQNSEENGNNGERILHEEVSGDGSSDGRSDEDSEDKVRNIILVDEGAPAYLKEFNSFQLEAYKKAKAVGLFVNADLYQTL